MVITVTRLRTSITGKGLNVQNTLLPVADVNALGFLWLRCQFGSSVPALATLQAFIAHYSTYYPTNKMLVILPYTAVGATVTAYAARLQEAGFVDIECGNENDDAGVTVAQFKTFCNTIRAQVGRSVRLHGPSGLNYTTLQSHITANMDVDGISWHDYGVAPEDVPARFDLIKTKVRRDVLMSEVSYEPLAVYSTHPTSALDAITRYTTAMGDRPWIWYDGPNSQAEVDGGSNRGLFGSADGYATFTVRTTLCTAYASAIGITLAP